MKEERGLAVDASRFLPKQLEVQDDGDDDDMDISKVSRYWFYPKSKDSKT